MNGAGPRQEVRVGQRVTDLQLHSAEFAPTEHFNGQVNFSYKAIDVEGQNELSETEETIQINVLAINDDPVLKPALSSRS